MLWLTSFMSALSTQILAQLVESIADGVVVIDPNGTHLLVNQAFQTMTGFAEADLVGHGTPHPYWAPERMDEITAAFGSTMRGEPGPYYLTFRRKNETRFPVLVNPSVVEVDGGESLTIAVVRERTDEVRQAGELEEAHRLIQAMGQAGQLGWFLWDLEHGWSKVSSAYHAVLGHPTHGIEATYEGWAKLVHPRDIADADASMSDLIAGRSDWYEAEYRFQTERGEWQWIRARGLAIERDAEGNAAVLAGTVEDFERVKRQEERLQQFQKMEIVGQMAGGVAHDFNNLLMVLSGNLDLLRLECPGAEEHIEQMQMVLDRATELTRSMLRLREDDGELDKEAVDLCEALRLLKPVLARTVGDEIEVRWNIPSGPCMVELIPSQFDSTVLNVALNARDALEGHSGRIEISGSIVTHGETEARRLGIRPGSMFEVRVEDDGPGMTRDVLERACEPLFTTKPRGKGTGLGLAMVRKFVLDANGAVRIRSRVGQGTTISLKYPLVEHPTIEGLPDDASPPSPSTEARRGTIVLVDDDEDILRLLAAHLRRAGFEVLASTHPRQALVAASAHPVDVLVTDVVMPFTIDGIELAQMVRSIHADLPIVFVTGYADPVRLEAARELGTVLRKPFRMAELEALVQALIARGDD